MTENEAIKILTLSEEEQKEFPNLKEIYAIAVKALEEVQQYRAIGTVEQCRGAVEKMKPKKAIEYENKFYGCPNCSNPLMHKWEKYPTILVDKSQGLPYCLNCGQAIDWSDTPETENT